MDELEVKLNLLAFSSVVQKVQKMQALIYRVIAKQHVKRKQTAHPVCLHAVEVQKGGREHPLVHRMITKQQVKNEQIKRKQTSPVSFVKVFKFQDNMFKIVQKNFQAIIVKKISWKTHHCHNDHYTINMGGQRPKTKPKKIKKVFQGWSWFKFNNLGLALGMVLKFYTIVAKWLKVKFGRD